MGISFERPGGHNPYGQWKIVVGTRPHFKGEKTPGRMVSISGLRPREDAERIYQLLSNEINAPILTRPQYRQAIFEGFDAVPTKFQPEPEFVAEYEVKPKPEDQSVNYTYIIRLTDRVGGPDRIIGGYARDPRRRAQDYAQTGFDVKLERFDGPYIGRARARRAEDVLLNELAEHFEQIAPEAFVDWSTTN